MRIDVTRRWFRVAICLAALFAALPVVRGAAAGTEPERTVLAARAGTTEVADLLAEAVKATAQGNPEAALPLAQKAVTLAPGAPEPYYQLGLVYRALARDNEAEQAFSRAARLGPSEPRYHYALGLAYRQTGKENLALAEFLQVLRLKPEDPAAHYQAGELLADQGDPEEAARHWEAALQSSPDFTPALKALGQYHYGQDRVDEALALWEKAAAQDAYDADLWWLLANGLAERNRGDDWADAVWAFQRFRNVASPSTDPARLQQADRVLAGNADRAARRFVARGIQAEQDPKQAAIYFNRALDLRPDFAEAYYNLGLSLQRSGRYAEAAAAYEQAATLAPGQAAVHANLGTAYLAMKRPFQAEKELRRALELAPHDKAIRLNLAIALWQEGSVADGRAGLETLIAEDPVYAPAYYNLACLEASVGRKAEALAALRRAVELEERYRETARQDPDLASLAGDLVPKTP